MTNSYQQDGPRVLQIFPNTSVYQLETRLPKRLCDEINDYFINNVDPEPGRLDVSTINEDERSVNVRWCQQDDWIGPFIYQYISQANEHLFQYDISGIYYNCGIFYICDLNKSFSGQNFSQTGKKLRLILPSKSQLFLPF